MCVGAPLKMMRGVLLRRHSLCNSQHAHSCVHNYMCCLCPSTCCLPVSLLQPEGVATFAATLASPATGVVIAIAIALHNVSNRKYRMWLDRLRLLTSGA